MYIADNVDFFDDYEAEIARLHRMYHRNALAVDMEESDQNYCLEGGYYGSIIRD